MDIIRKIKLSIKWIGTKLNLIEGKLYLSSSGNLVSGKKNYYFKGKLFVRDSGKVIFGNYCDIGHNLRLITTTHNSNIPMIQTRLYWDYFNGEYPDPNKEKRSIKIGSDVWFGDNVTILPEVEVGDGSIIGAGSVVSGNVPPYSIVIGIPAKVIKYRFNKEVREFLLNLKWWNWDENKIRRNKKFFKSNLNSHSVNEIKKMIK